MCSSRDEIMIISSLLLHICGGETHDIVDSLLFRTHKLTHSIYMCTLVWIDWKLIGRHNYYRELISLQLLMVGMLRKKKLIKCCRVGVGHLGEGGKVCRARDTWEAIIAAKD